MKKEDRIYTYADYLGWPDDERWELIDGAAADPGPTVNVKRYGRPEVYGPDDTFKSGVLEGFSLDLAAVLSTTA